MDPGVVAVMIVLAIAPLLNYPLRGNQDQGLIVLTIFILLLVGGAIGVINLIFGEKSIFVVELT